MTPPDVEEYLSEVLAGIGAVKVWAYDSAPAVHGIVEQTTVQVDTRAASKERACDLSHHARALILALPGQPWHDGIVLGVSEVAGPLWAPDVDGAPRYVFRCTLSYRNTR